MTANPWTVRDVMTERVLAVKAGTPFKQIVQALQEWKVSAAPVVDDRLQVIGVVSEADLLPREAGREGAEPGTADPVQAGAVTAAQLMTAPAFTVPADAPLARAARLMALHRVKRLPVVDEQGRLKGVVSRADLLKVFTRPDEDIAAEVRQLAAEYFPTTWETLDVRVADGVVTLSGVLTDHAAVPVAARLVRSIEGVVDVTFDLCNAAAPLTAPP